MQATINSIRGASAAASSSHSDRFIASEWRSTTGGPLGEEDPGTPPATARAIHNEIKGSTLIVAPGLSHMPCTEEPAIFNGYITAFLDKQPAIAA